MANGYVDKAKKAAYNHAYYLKNKWRWKNGSSGTRSSGSKWDEWQSEFDAKFEAAKDEVKKAERAALERRKQWELSNAAQIQARDREKRKQEQAAQNAVVNQRKRSREKTVTTNGTGVHVRKPYSDTAPTIHMNVNGRRRAIRADLAKGTYSPWSNHYEKAVDEAVSALPKNQRESARRKLNSQLQESVNRMNKARDKAYAQASNAQGNRPTAMTTAHKQTLKNKAKSAARRFASYWKGGVNEIGLKAKRSMNAGKKLINSIMKKNK